MELAILVGMSAFVILAIIVVILMVSGRKDISDPVTQEIIVKANTAPVRTQEEEH